MKAALAVCGNEMSESLGTARIFVIADREDIRWENLTEPLLDFLQQHGVDTVICDGVGNCMLALLAMHRISVIPGVRENIDEVILQWRAGTLQAGKNFSCTEHGCTCGDCKGNF